MERSHAGHKVWSAFIGLEPERQDMATAMNPVFRSAYLH